MTEPQSEKPESDETTYNVDSSESHRQGLVRSGFEKRGGYPSPETPLAMLPQVPAGPAPGAAAAPAADNEGATETS